MMTVNYKSDETLLISKELTQIYYLFSEARNLGSTVLQYPTNAVLDLGHPYNQLYQHYRH